VEEAEILTEFGECSMDSAGAGFADSDFGTEKHPKTRDLAFNGHSLMVRHRVRWKGLLLRRTAEDERSLFAITAIPGAGQRNLVGFSLQLDSPVHCAVHKSTSFYVSFGSSVTTPA
jgi:hypothetical protein